MRPGPPTVDKIVLLAVTGSEGDNVAVVIWEELSVAELQAEERITIEVTPAGDWNCGSSLEEIEGRAGTLDAGKLASAGALANLLEWYRQWQARDGDLLIIEVPEDDVITYVWHFERYTKRHKYGEAPTLEAAQAAAIQAAGEIATMVKKSRDSQEIDRMDEVERQLIKVRFLSTGPPDGPVRITLSGGTTISGKVTGGCRELHPPDQVSSYVIVTDSDGDHTIDLLDVVSVDPGSADVITMDSQR